MNLKRAAGVLCHISSLPGKYGIGGLGKEAYAFARKLAASGVTYWQILPLVQTGYGDSPYQSVATNSGNPYFIDLDALAKRKLVTREELQAAVSAGEIDYGKLYETRYPLLRKAFSRFSLEDPSFRDFVKRGEFEDYALFMTAKTVYGGTFSDWEEGLKRREADSLERLRTDYHEEYLFWQFLQYSFSVQWKRLKRYCNKLGIKIIGDIPLYVAYDSADVWANPALFQLDGELKPVKVAGVPPDYFSRTGQLWGNPVFDWAAHEKTGYAWWRNRLRAALETYDLVRIDHFRGIDRYWEVPAEHTTAEHGEWKDGPKEALFTGFSSDQIIAEDLGVMDEGVKTLLKNTGFAGMKVLLFAFDGDENNEFLPHNIGENCVVYTGTHDNDTVVGYLESLSTEEFILFRSRLAAELEEIGLYLPLTDEPKQYARVFAEMALCTKARLAILPVQDILGLNNDARMNFPGTKGENWKFRLDSLPAAIAMHRLKILIKKYKRR